MPERRRLSAVAMGAGECAWGSPFLVWNGRLVSLVGVGGQEAVCWESGVGWRTKRTVGGPVRLQGGDDCTH